MFVIVCLCVYVPSTCHQDCFRSVSNNIFLLFLHTHTHTFTHMYTPTCCSLALKHLQFTEDCYQSVYMKLAFHSSHTHLVKPTSTRPRYVQTLKKEERLIPTSYSTWSEDKNKKNFKKKTSVADIKRIPNLTPKPHTYLKYTYEV